MADRYNNSVQTQRMHRSTSANPIAKLLQKLQEHAPNSGQLIGLLAFLITGSVLLLLTGVTVTVSVIAMIFFTPLILISSPIWVPVGTVLFLIAFAICSTCGFGVAIVAGLSWIYKYFRGYHPPGSDRVDFARSRIYDTASHVKDYALEYGGYLQSKVKDAAPGA